MNQRGTWLLESWMWNTWASSCHSVMPRLNFSSFGLIAASVLPKHTPWIAVFGRPLVRIAKFWRSAYSSTPTGVVGVKPYPFDVSCARPRRAGCGT